MEHAGDANDRNDQPRANHGSGQQTPAMSIILPADQPDTIRGVLNRLGSQTIAAQLEIVVATATPTAFDEIRAAQTGFHSLCVVDLPDLTSLGRARARAIQSARAPCVFLGETHSFAAVPEWAERLVARHREGWAVVVPGFRNANPKHFLSWSGFLLDYGSWTEHEVAGEIEYWPLNNACCDRSALLESTDDLSHALSYGDQLILALRRSGHKVWFEPAAALSHLNICRWKAWLDEHWVAGHLVARYRSRDWSPARRWAFVAAFPAIAVVLFSRVLRPAWRTVRRLKLPMIILPTMLVGVIARAFGELVGYTHWGTEEASERRMTEYELHKVNYT